MANEKRVRNDNVQGTLSSTMSAAGTTINSAGLANLEAISSTEHAAIIIDPGRTAGAPEIVYVTAHTGAATSATVVRAREGTSARTHSSTERWVHAPTAIDWRGIQPVELITSTASTMLPYGVSIITSATNADRVFKLASPAYVGATKTVIVNTVAGATDTAAFRHSSTANTWFGSTQGTLTATTGGNVLAAASFVGASTSQWAIVSKTTGLTLGA